MEFGGFEKCTLIDYPEKLACIVYTIGCPFRCPYCHNPELVEEYVTERISENEVLAFLDTRKRVLDGVVITGGEPTMHGEKLLHFMEEVKRRGFLVKLDTNGTSVGVLKEAIDRKLVDYIAMDIKAPLEKYQEVVARPVDLESIKQSVALIMASGVPYEFRTTVVKTMLTEEDFDAIGAWIRGAEHYYLQAFVPTRLLNPQFLRKATYSKEEFEALQKKLSCYVKHCEVR